MRADGPVCDTGLWGFGNALRRFVGWDGVRNQCRHDDAKSPSWKPRHLKLIVLTFQFLFRHADNCPETDLNKRRARVCTCARPARDANAIADSADFRPFVAETYCWVHRSRKSFTFFPACFRAMGSGTTTRGAVVRATTRGLIGPAVLGAEARLSIISFATGADGDCR